MLSILLMLMTLAVIVPILLVCLVVFSVSAYLLKDVTAAGWWGTLVVAVALLGIFLAFFPAVIPWVLLIGPVLFALGFVLPYASYSDARGKALITASGSTDPVPPAEELAPRP